MTWRNAQISHARLLKHRTRTHALPPPRQHPIASDPFGRYTALTLNSLLSAARHLDIVLDMLSAWRCFDRASQPHSRTKDTSGYLLRCASGRWLPSKKQLCNLVRTNKPKIMSNSYINWHIFIASLFLLLMVSAGAPSAWHAPKHAEDETTQILPCPTTFHHLAARVARGHARTHILEILALLFRRVAICHGATPGDNHAPIEHMFTHTHTHTPPRVLACVFTRL